MSDNFPLFPDPSIAFAKQQENLEKRRELARSLIRQGMSQDIGQGFQGGKVYIVGNPLGNIAASLGGAYLDDKAAGEQQALQQQEQAAAQQLIKRLGTRGTVEQSYDPTTNPGTGPLINGTVPMTPEEESQRRIGVMGEGMAIPSLRSILEKQISAELGYPEERRKEAAKHADAIELKKTPTVQRYEMGDNAFKVPANYMLDPADKTKLIPIPGGPADKPKAAAQSNFKIPAGYMLNEDGTGVVPIKGGPKDPATKPKPLDKAEAQAAADSRSVNEILDLVDKTVDKATGSGAGKLRDQIAGFFGESTEAGDAAASMASLGGLLVSKMPKMSGPQSDKDVLLYKQMAGRIGDPEVPTSQKKAAIKTLRELHKKYPSAMASSGDPARIGSDAEYDALPSGSTYVAPDGQIRRKK